MKKRLIQEELSELDQQNQALGQNYRITMTDGSNQPATYTASFEIAMMLAKKYGDKVEVANLADMTVANGNEVGQPAATVTGDGNPSEPIDGEEPVTESIKLRDFDDDELNAFAGAENLPSGGRPKMGEIDDWMVTVAGNIDNKDLAEVRAYDIGGNEKFLFSGTEEEAIKFASNLKKIKPGNNADSGGALGEFDNADWQAFGGAFNLPSGAGPKIAYKNDQILVVSGTEDEPDAVTVTVYDNGSEADGEGKEVYRSDDEAAVLKFAQNYLNGATNESTDSEFETAKSSAEFNEAMETMVGESGEEFLSNVTPESLAGIQEKYDALVGGSKVLCQAGGDGTILSHENGTFKSTMENPEMGEPEEITAGAALAMIVIAHDDTGVVVMESKKTEASDFADKVKKLAKDYLDVETVIDVVAAGESFIKVPLSAGGSLLSQSDFANAVKDLGGVANYDGDTNSFKVSNNSGKKESKNKPVVAGGKTNSDAKPAIGAGLVESAKTPLKTTNVTANKETNQMTKKRISEAVANRVIGKIKGGKVIKVYREAEEMGAEGDSFFVAVDGGQEATAEIKVDGDQIFVGPFSTPDEAAAAVGGTPEDVAIVNGDGQPAGAEDSVEDSDDEFSDNDVDDLVNLSPDDMPTKESIARSVFLDLKRESEGIETTVNSGDGSGNLDDKPVKDPTLNQTAQQIGASVASDDAASLDGKPNEPTVVIKDPISGALITNDGDLSNAGDGKGTAKVNENNTNIGFAAGNMVNVFDVASRVKIDRGVVESIDFKAKTFKIEGLDEAYDLLKVSVVKIY